MFRSMFTVGGFTLMSRVLGFVRDKLIATHLGAGQLGDVWVAAFALPNMFRRVFGEGAFNSAFVPLYSRKIETEGDESANLFASRTVSLMFLLLAAIFLLLFLFMGPVIAVTNWGFRDDARMELAIPAARITVGYLIFICLTAALSGILNSRKIFGAPAFAYVVLNIVLIAVLLGFMPFFDDPLRVLCIGVIVAGVLQFAVVLVAVARAGIRILPTRPTIDADIRRLGILMVPGLISAGIQQLNLLVGGAIASIDVGGRSYIYYSDRINQLPLGIIGMAAGVVLLPEITRSLRSGRISEARKSLAFGTDASVLLCIPAMVAMLVIPGQIMHAIFEGGALRPEDAAGAGTVLAAFAVGMPAYVLVRVLQPGYFAREDTRTPMKFSLATAAVNMALAYPLFLLMGVTGCAFATSIAGWLNVALLWTGLYRDGFVTISYAMGWRYLRMFLSACGMGVAIWFLADLAEPWLLREGGFLFRMAVLSLLVLAGVAIYFGFIFLTRVFGPADLRRLLIRENNSPGA